MMRRRSLRIDLKPTIEGPGPLPESEFSFSLARVAVAQICQSMGFKGAQKSALEALTDVATRYLQALGKLGAASANSDGRTASNLSDIIVALEDLASIQGFRGLSSVRSVSLYTSAVIKDLMKLVKYSDEIPFARPFPPRRIYSSGKFLKCNTNSRGYCDEHVPRWLPAQPVVEGKEKGLEKKKEVAVKWGCLDGGGEDENQRALSDEEIEISSSSLRGKVRFKPGMVGNLTGKRIQTPS